jgi:hypothetical protein
MEPNKILLEAIARRMCVEACYNRMVVKLAPHILYTRHGDLFIDAVTVEREGKPPREIKIGTFKLAGLDVRGLTDRQFDIDATFDPANDKYEGVTLFAVEAA